MCYPHEPHALSSRHLPSPAVERPNALSSIRTVLLARFSRSKPFHPPPSKSLREGHNTLPRTAEISEEGTKHTLRSSKDPPSAELSVCPRGHRSSSSSVLTHFREFSQKKPFSFCPPTRSPASPRTVTDSTPPPADIRARCLGCLLLLSLSSFLLFFFFPPSARRLLGAQMRSSTGKKDRISVRDGATVSRRFFLFHFFLFFFFGLVLSGSAPGGSVARSALRKEHAG